MRSADDPTLVRKIVGYWIRENVPIFDSTSRQEASLMGYTIFFLIAPGTIVGTMISYGKKDSTSMGHRFGSDGSGVR
jgi:hypothetical protein